MKHWLSFLSTLLLFFYSFQAWTFNAAKEFQTRCSGCHSIGKGRRVGPDLKDVTKRRKRQWLVSFVTDAQRMADTGDANAISLIKKYGMAMPPQVLSREEILSMLDFIEAGGGAKSAVASSDQYRATSLASKDDVNQGEKFFVGTSRLKKGGPACVSCHSAGTAGLLGGGGLGPDLTKSFSKYKDQGLSGVLSKISFPIMKDVYKDKQLTDGEVFQIKSFLHNVDKQDIKSSHKSNTKKFLFLGTIGFLLVLGLLDLLWLRRRKKTSRPQ